MSSLQWLATSERERQQAMELARAFAQKESRDELGLGSVRDGLSELLFPGTSTLHTRARYFLFIPWAYQRAAGKASKRPLKALVREAEADLINGFSQDGDLSGLIGRDKKGAIQRMPSTLYWRGLHVWGVRLMPGSQSVIERTLTQRPQREGFDEAGDPFGDVRLVWHPELPTPPAGHPSGATFDLTRNEADFLAERLRTLPATRSSALASLTAMEADHRSVANIWEHPDRTSLSSAQQHTIEQARRFSLLMHGAAWIYNVILADLAQLPTYQEAHRASFVDWATRLEADRHVISNWSLDELWAETARSDWNVPPRTRQFIHTWMQMVSGGQAASLVDRPDVRDLIMRREQQMKGRNARTVNKRALQQWGGASGTAALDFRWSTARGLIADVRDGLEAS